MKTCVISQNLCADCNHCEFFGYPLSSYPLIYILHRDKRAFVLSIALEMDSLQTIVLCSTGAMVIGFLFDIAIGDPPRFPHIVRLMGALVSKLEKLTRHVLPKTQRCELIGGIVLAAVIMLIFTGSVLAGLIFAYRFSILLGLAIESLLCGHILAIKSLRTESMKVYKGLKSGDIMLTRKNVAMIVGRDTETLDEAGISRAAVETVAENTADGVIAPMFFIMLGGAALGCLYKAVSTMDSMLGYRNERYLWFGRAAARLDDAFGWIPARLSALLIILSAALTGHSARGAARIWRRDRRNHASPNSGQSEAACAGALGIRIAGPASYRGVLHEKPYIGDDIRPITPEDIISANRLMYASAAVMFVAAVIVRVAIFAVLW